MHLSRNTPPFLVKETFALCDDRVQQYFSECTAVDASASNWLQAQLMNLHPTCSRDLWVLGGATVVAFSKLAGRISTRLNEPKSKTIFGLYSRLGLALVRANCRAILSRLT